MTPAAQPVAMWLAQGQSALEAGRYTDAAVAFTRARDASPGDRQIALMVAQTWQLAGRVADERRALKHVYRLTEPQGNVSVAPIDIPALYSLGSALLAVGAPCEAVGCFERVAADRPTDAAVLGALASALRAAGDPFAAWPLAQRALARAPNEPAHMLTAAQVRHALGDIDGALEWLERAERRRPNHAPTRLQRALTRLLGGPSAAGWADFEHRGLPVGTANSRRWHGEPLTGSTLVVLAEQGLGDHFHFARFISLLVARGASRVIVECHPDAVSLFRASGVDAVAQGTAPDADWFVPILSLPYALGTDASVASARMPYLGTGEPHEAPAPRAGGRRRLGLVVQGNPAFLATELRDFDTTLLPELLDIPGIDWVWLQYGETPPLEHPALCTPPLTANWLDTARLLQSLDGVVTVDTSIAHLAGALNIPVYVLLPHAPDWRWGLNSSTSSWYPSAQLVRQPTSRDWSGAVHRLRELLAPFRPADE